MDLLNYINKMQKMYGDQASLADDLEPGALKDEMLKDFDPSQETYEEYLQRKSLERPFNMSDGGMIGKPGGIVEPGVMYYGKNVMSGSPAQQAENIRRENESLKKISELFKKKDYTGLKTRTPIARIKQGMEDKGGKLNQPQVNKITKAMEGGLKTQKEFAKKLGITLKQFLDGVKKSKSKISLEKSETMSKQMLKKVEFQEKLFKEIVDNPNATVDSMTKKFKVDKKYLVSQSSKLLKNVYAQNVSIAKGPEFDLDSRGKATLKSWLPDDFDTTEKFLGRFANIDGFKKIQAENMGILIKNAYAKTNPKKYADAMKALTKYNNFKNNLPKGLKVDLDHPLSKVFLKGSGVSPDKLLYVTPVNRDFNRGFKMQMGNRYAKALLQGDKAAIKNVRVLADKLKINIGDVKGSKLGFGTTKFDTKKDFGKEYMANIKEQTTVAEKLSKLQKTKEGRQIIKDAGFKKGQIKEVQKITKGVISQLEKLGCGKAAGGRILFSEGTPGATLTKCARKGSNKLEQILLKGGANKNEQVLANSILRAGTGLKNMFSLRGFLGPAALAFTAAAEAGIVGYDMLAEGKTFKEAVGDSVFNYALGPKLKIDSIEERNKRFRKLGVNEKDMGKIAAFESALGDIDRIENIFTKDQITKQKLEEAKKFFPAVVDKRQKEADAVRADIQDLARTGTEQRLMNVDYDAGAKALEEAKKLATIDRLTSRGPQILGQIFPKAEESRKQRILDASSIVNPAHNIPGMREATGGYLYGFASGGLIGDKSGPASTGGPMSQGLRSLYNNGKKL